MGEFSQELFTLKSLLHSATESFCPQAIHGDHILSHSVVIHIECLEWFQENIPPHRRRTLCDVPVF
jgi:hypothetical protein